jgi:hypothetical protein
MRISTWVVRALAGAAAFALIGGLAACSTPGQAGSAKPAQPQTAPSPSAAPNAVDYDQLALDELDKIINGTSAICGVFLIFLQTRNPFTDGSSTASMIRSGLFAAATSTPPFPSADTSTATP